LSHEQLAESLLFLQYIGAVKEEKRRLVVTDHGEQILARIYHSHSESKMGN
jgi:hypothetical protein